MLVRRNKPLTTHHSKNDAKDTAPSTVDAEETSVSATIMARLNASAAPTVMATMTTLKNKPPIPTSRDFLGTTSELLAALSHYNARRNGKYGWHKLVLYPDGSGFILNDFGRRHEQFDTLEQCLEMLRS